jgi:hypothetical protein
MLLHGALALTPAGRPYQRAGVRFIKYSPKTTFPYFVPNDMNVRLMPDSKFERFS